MTAQADVSIPPPANRATALESLALISLLVLTFGLTLVRVDVTDTPWHLATARLAYESGKWPTTNTFSWTHPGYPLQQQYPVYQSMLYAAYSLGSWEGLSIFQATIWTTIFSLAIKWGGGWRWASCCPALWLLGFLGLQRRMTLRPDIATFLVLFGLLLSIDAFRRGRTWTAILFVLFQWLFANSHQLFPIGIAIQGGLLIEAIAAHWWPARFDAAGRRLPIAPIAIALVASCVACLFTPLGWQIVYTPLHTASSLSHHRFYLEEFRPIWTDQYALNLALLCGLTTLWSFQRIWPKASVYEMLLWLIVGAVAASAVRGAAMFCIISIGIAARNLRRASLAGVANSSIATGLIRNAVAAVIVLVAVVLLNNRWTNTDRDLMAFQPGVGKWRGWWPDSTIDFLKSNPPPGKMLNLGWFAGNSLIWGLYPKPEVFVDPRFEAFPRDFLLDAIAAEKDPGILDRLIAEFKPTWIVGEIRLDEVCDQAARLLRDGNWRLVHLDSVLFVLVRSTSESASYITSLTVKPEDWVVANIEKDHPEVACFQHLQLSQFFERLSRQALKPEPILQRSAKELEAAKSVGKGLRSFESHLSRTVQD